MRIETTARLGLHETIEALAAFNRSPELGGITREVYTPEYDEAVALTARFMQERGLRTRIDAAGNLFGRLEGTAPGLPYVLTGSHIDTTLNAGRFDGVIGVLGGAEAVAALAASAPPRRSIEVVAFAGEEPRFGMGCIGSQLIAGRIDAAALNTLVDRDGISIADAMRIAGLDPDAVTDALVEPADIHAILELHIEQGGRLERDGIGLGVVTRIAAAHDLRVTLTGRALHSGATPMDLRSDALLGAAEAALAVERIARATSTGTTVGTVGVLDVLPGAANVIPGTASFVVDIRDSDGEVRDRAVAGFRAELAAICARRGLAAEITVVQDNQPSVCDPGVVEAARAGCEAIGQPYLVMQSGAYHDCMSFAPEVPIGMLFVPSAGGISHHPDEYTAPGEIDLGVRALTEALRRLAA